jgi:prepilin-type processing-associated H-X9-DG protein
MGGTFVWGHSLERLPNNLPYGSYGYNWTGTEAIPQSRGDRSLRFGLGVGGELIGTDLFRAARESEIKNASGTFAFGDGLLQFGSLQDDEPQLTGHSDLGRILHLGSFRNSAHPGSKSYAPMLKLDRARHQSRVNLLFCDGHVEQRKTLDLLKREALPSWNRDSEPHADGLDPLFVFQ